ncbi:MAG: glycosyltransferase family 2 protein [Pseudomonadota bacterium]
MNGVSCIFTVYNKSKCLEKMINSLKSQMGNLDLDYIFVNDGSTDNSLEVLNTLCRDLPNSVIVSQENQGPSVAVNTGLKLATKQWVYLGDSDDYIYPDSIITLVELAKQYNSKMSHGRHVNDVTLEKTQFNHKVTVYDDALEKALSFHPCGGGLIVDRELLVRIGGCDERVFVQDYSISLRLAQHTKFVTTNKITSCNIDLNQERLSSNKLQENHDTAYARYLFMQDNMHIARKYKSLTLRKQMAKSWSWYRKQRFIPRVWSKYFLRYILSKFTTPLRDETMELWMRERIEVYDKSKLRKFVS